MGNTVGRGKAPGDDLGYRNEAYMNLKKLIEEEDSGSDDDTDQKASNQTLPRIVKSVSTRGHPEETTATPFHIIGVRDEKCRSKRGRSDSDEMEPRKIKMVRLEAKATKTRRKVRLTNPEEPCKDKPTRSVSLRLGAKTMSSSQTGTEGEDEVDHFMLNGNVHTLGSTSEGEECGMQWNENNEIEQRRSKMTSPSDVDSALVPSKRGQTSDYGLVQRCDSTGIEHIDPSQYALPFENLVFEGGGNKGLAHCGALKYLEKIGFHGDKIKRVAGASAGAIMATLVAVGYSATEIEKEMRQNNMKQMFLDGSWLGIIRNLFYYFGMHEANVIYKWLGDKLAHKAKEKNIKSVKGKAEDITFEEVYMYFHRELCVVVTNLNRMTTEYCHPKTTPRMAVREAVRMSTSLPGLFTAKLYQLHGDVDMFVDGGVLCNYPIHCFDGWYLSLLPEDNFTEKMQNVEDLQQLYESRFDGGYITNMKTLGISIYAENEEDLLKHELEMKHGRPEPGRPDEYTQLYLEWEENNRTRRKYKRISKRREEASIVFLEVLQKCSKDENNDILIEEIKEALEENPFLQERKEEIFLDDPSNVFSNLDTEKTGKINYGRLIGEMGDLGMQIQCRSLGCQRSPIDGFYSFLDRIQSTLLLNVKKSYVKLRDAQRTVGINTGHVETNSFDLETADKDFVIQRGENACRTFLQRFIVNHRIRLK